MITSNEKKILLMIFLCIYGKKLSSFCNMFLFYDCCGVFPKDPVPFHWNASYSGSLKWNGSRSATLESRVSSAIERCVAVWLKITVCPRSLDLFYIVACLINWVNFFGHTVLFFLKTKSKRMYMFVSIHLGDITAKSFSLYFPFSTFSPFPCLFT